MSCVGLLCSGLARYVLFWPGLSGKLVGGTICFMIWCICVSAGRCRRCRRGTRWRKPPLTPTPTPTHYYSVNLQPVPQWGNKFMFAQLQSMPFSCPATFRSFPPSPTPPSSNSSFLDSEELLRQLLRRNVNYAAFFCLIRCRIVNDFIYWKHRPTKNRITGQMKQRSRANKKKNSEGCSGKERMTENQKIV